MTRPALLLALVAIVSALSVAPAEAKRPRGGDARAALVKVKQLQQGKGVRTGFELSPALAQLTASLPYLSASDRREAEAILSRPDDGQADPENTHKWTGTEAPASPVCGEHFCVHWTAGGGDVMALAAVPGVAGTAGLALEVESAGSTAVLPASVSSVLGRLSDTFRPNV